MGMMQEWMLLIQQESVPIFFDQHNSDFPWSSMTLSHPCRKAAWPPKASHVWPGIPIHCWVHSQALATSWNQAFSDHCLPPTGQWPDWASQSRTGTIHVPVFQWTSGQLGQPSAFSWVPVQQPCPPCDMTDPIHVRQGLSPLNGLQASPSQILSEDCQQVQRPNG